MHAVSLSGSNVTFLWVNQVKSQQILTFSVQKSSLNKSGNNPSFVMGVLIHIAEDAFYINYINMLGCEIFEMIICVCVTGSHEVQNGLELTVQGQP